MTALNRRETYLTDRIGRKVADRRIVLLMRDRAQDAIAAAMRDITCPAERAVMAQEAVTWAAAVMAQAAGHVRTGSHLASLAGQVYAVGEKMAKGGAE